MINGNHTRVSPKLDAPYDSPLAGANMRNARKPYFDSIARGGENCRDTSEPAAEIAHDVAYELLYRGPVAVEVPFGSDKLAARPHVSMKMIENTSSSAKVIIKRHAQETCDIARFSFWQ
jgi:hypothetical protein